MKIHKKYVLQHEPFIGALIIKEADYKGDLKLKLHWQLPGVISSHIENSFDFSGSAEQVDRIKNRLLKELKWVIDFNLGNGAHITDSMRKLNNHNKYYARKLTELIKTKAVQKELFEVI